MKKVQCCNCGKIIGELISDGGINSPIGFIPSCHEKLDYRKSSHIWIDSKEWGHGTLCKTCAKKVFPEGKAYQVMRYWHGKKMPIFVGEYGYGDYFTTKAEADNVSNERNCRYGCNSHWVEEFAL